jgi:hypothetical protein
VPTNCSRDKESVAVSDDVVDAMRAYLGALHASTGDAFDESDRRFLTLLQANRYAGLDVLLQATFTIAARHKFAPVWNLPQVIRYVAEVRSDAPEMASLLNHKVAEDQLRNALGAELPAAADVETCARAQLILLAALTIDYADIELDALMNDAKKAIG